MLVPEVLAQLKEWTAKVDTVVLCGIETHVCILATCQDLRAEGFNVSEATCQGDRARLYRDGKKGGPRLAELVAGSCNLKPSFFITLVIF